MLEPYPEWPEGLYAVCLKGLDLFFMSSELSYMRWCCFSSHDLSFYVVSHPLGLTLQSVYPALHRSWLPREQKPEADSPFYVQAQNWHKSLSLYSAGQSKSRVPAQIQRERNSLRLFMEQVAGVDSDRRNCWQPFHRQATTKILKNIYLEKGIGEVTMCIK